MRIGIPEFRIVSIAVAGLLALAGCSTVPTAPGPAQVSANLANRIGATVLPPTPPG